MKELKTKEKELKTEKVNDDTRKGGSALWAFDFSTFLFSALIISTEVE